MSRYETIIKLVLFLLVISLSVFANQNEQSRSSDQLENLKEQISILKYSSERTERGRLIVLEKKVIALEEQINMSGLGNMKTVMLFQDLVFSFRYSEAFLDSISSYVNKSYVIALKQTVDQIIKEKGFEESLTSSMVANLISQVENLLRQISNENINSDLQKFINYVISKEIGPALAHAKVHKDVKSTYYKFDSTYSVIKNNYKLFKSISPSSKAFEMTTELMGLMDLYNSISNSGLNTQESL
jgi:hypothetical protein